MEISLRKNGLTIGFIFLNMAILGIVHSMRGPALPFIQTEYALGYDRIAFMIIVCSLGMFLGVLIGGRICERFGYKRGLLFSTIIMFISLGSLSVYSGFEYLIIKFFFIYTALGCMDIALNALGSRVFITKTAILMSLTHFFFGAGSAGGAQYAGFMLDGDTPWRHIFISVLILYALSFAMIFFAKFPQTHQNGNANQQPFTTVIKDTRVWLAFGTTGFSSIFDFGIINWLVIYLRDTQNMTPHASASYLTLYFALFALGRLVGGVIAEKFGYVKIFFVCMLSAGLLFFAGIITGNALLFSGTGLFTSVFFPLFLSIIVKDFRDDAPSVISIIFPLNGVLFMLSSFVLGILMESIGVQTGFYVIGAFIVIAPIFLLSLNRKLIRKTSCSNN